MKTLALPLTLAFVIAAPVLAQIQVNGDDGSTVTIGPGGINVNSAGTHLNIGPGGIKGVAGGDTRLNITPQTVLRGAQTTVKRQTPSSSTTKVTTSTAVGAGSLQDQVARIEMTVSGKVSTGMPLTARVEKLELDNLGKPGTGSLKDRINALARSLGVNLSATPHAQAVPPGSSVSTVTTTSTVNSGPQGVQIQVQESGGSVISDHVVVNTSGQNLNYVVKGGSVTIDASDCNLRLQGHCERLIINGSQNNVTADKLSMIVVNGSSNTISWISGHSPKIIDNGSSNRLQSR